MEPLPRLPPTSLRGPRPLPLLGATGSLIRFFGDPVGQILSIHSRFGPLATLADRDPAVVCAFGAEFNRVVLSDQKRFENWADLPMKAPAASAVMLINKSLTAENGEVHKRHRRMMMPAFTRQAVERYRDKMADIALTRTAAFRPGQNIQLGREATEIALRIAMECLFGVDVSDDADSLGRLGLRFLQGLTNPLAMMLPWQIPGLPYKNFLDLGEKLRDRLRAVIAERRKSMGAQGDMLSLLIAAHDEEGGSFTDDELVGHATVMFIAGHETTAQTLVWTLFLLSQHPDVMRAVTAELQQKLGGAAPTVEQIGELKVLDRVVKESMRLLPATPFFFLRRATEPFSLGGTELPAGTRLILSSLITHRAPDRYPRPKRFLPDRWLTAEPSLYEYLPFGAGPRMCIGATFAAQAIRISLAVLLQRAHYQLDPGATVSRKSQGITMGSKHELPMRLVAPGEPIAVPAKLAGDIHDLVDLGPAS